MTDEKWLDNFIDTYQSLGVDDMSRLEKVYHSDVLFCDPIHRIQGLPALLEYFTHLYTHVSECQFEVTDVIIQQDRAAIYWNMRFMHSQLNKGQTIRVEGHSKLRQQAGKVIFHRDYLDLGEMLYEHIPLLGYLVKKIKTRAAQ